LKKSGLFIIYTPAKIKIIEINIDEVKCSLSARPHIVATIGIKYVTMVANIGVVSLTRRLNRAMAVALPSIASIAMKQRFRTQFSVSAADERSENNK
jgi:hypothetical protein